MAQLQGKNAIVTGAGGGFGAGIARLYAQEGANVVLADINLEAAQAVATDIGDAASAIKTDISVKADMEAAVNHAVNTFGSVDIIVNNAAITHKNQPMLEVDEETFDRVFAINVKSMYYMAQ